MTNLVPRAPSEVARVLTPDRAKPHVTREEVLELLAATSSPKHRLFIRMLWGLGCRVSELVGDPKATTDGPIEPMRGRDIFQRQGNYYVRLQRLKRRKTVYEEVRLPFDLAFAVDEWKRSAGIGARDPLLPNMARRSAYKWLRRKGFDVLDRAIGPHMFRHGFQYELAKDNVHPYQVTALMGHASVASAMAYFHPTEDDLLKDRERISI